MNLLHFRASSTIHHSSSHHFQPSRHLHSVPLEGAREIENVNWEALLNEEVARLRGSEATNKEEGGDFDFDFDDDDDDALSEISNPSLLSVEIITDTVEAAKKPTVAAIDGLALGGGGVRACN
ncbi:hypothetical protein HN51_043533, partial [Arachis hypogaea]